MTTRPGTGPLPAGSAPPARRGRLGVLLAVGSGNVAVLLLGLLSGVVASRVLGPDLRGELVAGQTWSAVAGVLLTLGVAQAVVTYKGADRGLISLLLAQAGGSLLLAGALFAVLSATGQQWLTPLGIIGGATLTASGVVGAVAAGYAQRQGRMVGAFQGVRLIPQACGVFAVIGLWVMGFQDPNLWLFWVGIALFVPSALVFLVLLGGIPALRRCGRITVPRPLRQAASAAMVTVVLVQVIYRLDTLLVAIALEPAQVALYAVAVTAAVACAAVAQSVGMVTFSRLRSVEKPAMQHTLIRQGVLQSLAVAAAVALPVAVAAPWLIGFLYGPEFVAATGATRVLVLAAIPLSADYLLQHVLLSLSAGRLAFRVQILAAAVTIGLLTAAVSSENLEWVAAVSIVVYSLSSTLMYITAVRRIGSRQGPLTAVPES